MIKRGSTQNVLGHSSHGGIQHKQKYTQHKEMKNWIKVVVNSWSLPWVSTNLPYDCGKYGFVCPDYKISPIFDYFLKWMSELEYLRSNLGNFSAKHNLSYENKVNLLCFQGKFHEFTIIHLKLTICFFCVQHLKSKQYFSSEDQSLFFTHN